jgi:hypothetical protein
MNRFRKLGFVEYNGRIRVHKSLLNVVLHDQLPEHNPVSHPLGGVRTVAQSCTSQGAASVSKIEQYGD